MISGVSLFSETSTYIPKRINGTGIDSEDCFLDGCFWRTTRTGTYFFVDDFSFLLPQVGEVIVESFDGVSDSFALIGFDSIFDCPEMDYPPVNQ